MKRSLLLLLALLFAACAGQTDPAPIVNATPAPAIEDAIVFVTPAPTPAPTASHEPTPEPTEIPTPERTPEPTPEPEPFVPRMLPDGMRVRNGYAGSSFTGIVRRNSDGAYFAYGTVGETEPCFYPCDEHGAVALGESPVSGDLIVPAYTPTDPPKRTAKSCWSCISDRKASWALRVRTETGRSCAS